MSDPQALYPCKPLTSNGEHFAYLDPTTNGHRLPLRPRDRSALEKTYARWCCGSIFGIIAWVLAVFLVRTVPIVVVALKNMNNRRDNDTYAPTTITITAMPRGKLGSVFDDVFYPCHSKHAYDHTDSYAFSTNELLPHGSINPRRHFHLHVELKSKSASNDSDNHRAAINAPSSNLPYHLFTLGSHFYNDDHPYNHLNNYPPRRGDLNLSGFIHESIRHNRLLTTYLEQRVHLHHRHYYHHHHHHHPHQTCLGQHLSAQCRTQWRHDRPLVDNRHHKNPARRPPRPPDKTSTTIKPISPITVKRTSQMTCADVTCLEPLYRVYDNAHCKRTASDNDPGVPLGAKADHGHTIYYETTITDARHQVRFTPQLLNNL